MTPRAAPTLISLGLVLAVFTVSLLIGGPLPASVKNASRETRAPTSANPASSPAPAPSAVPASRPAGYLPRVATGLIDHHGVAAGVSCTTCHTTREPDRATGLAGTVPKDFHQGLVYAHGGLSCLSCHHADDYDSLRLADGRKLAFAQSQQLCAQCHGPQTRDYLNGAHGGMSGHWDKTKGERTRLTCVDCHDPHAPAYPVWAPVFPPRDAAALQQAEREARADRHE